MTDAGAMVAGRSVPADADLAVVEALRRGDEQAFVRLVEKHQPTLRRMARLFVSNPAVAEEVLQDTWLGVIQGLWAFEGRSSLRTWILRILVNRAKTRAVRERRTVPFADLGVDHLDASEAAVRLDRFFPEDHPTQPGYLVGPQCDLGPSPEGRLLAREAREQLQNAIAGLPPAQRVVLTLRDVEGCSAEEVCNVLGIHETNQRVLLHRARSKVRTALEPYLSGE